MALGHTAACEDEDPVLEPEPEIEGPPPKAFYTVDELAELGFGHRTTIYEAVKRGEIPSVRFGRKILIPTQWARKAMGR